MAVPAMKMKITAKKVKWDFIEYIPKEYNYRTDTN